MRRNSWKRAGRWSAWNCAPLADPQRHCRTLESRLPYLLCEGSGRDEEVAVRDRSQYNPGKDIPKEETHYKGINDGLVVKKRLHAFKVQSYHTQLQHINTSQNRMYSGVVSLARQNSPTVCRAQHESGRCPDCRLGRTCQGDRVEWAAAEQNALP